MFRSLVEQSRKLRRQQTPQERKLWKHLRARNLGVKFRKQYVIGFYIADFCCPERKIVIELDGYGHTEKVQKERDKERDSCLEHRGYKILRFWNSEIDRNLEEVVEHIDQVITPPHPDPLPNGRGG
jgi:very-short-patch-repair endonuclease